MMTLLVDLGLAGQQPAQRKSHFGFQRTVVP